jgi:hypothetical protein
MSSMIFVASNYNLEILCFTILVIILTALVPLFLQIMSGQIISYIDPI